MAAPARPERSSYSGDIVGKAPARKSGRSRTPAFPGNYSRSRSDRERAENCCCALSCGNSPRPREDFARPNMVPAISFSAPPDLKSLKAANAPPRPPNLEAALVRTAGLRVPAGLASLSHPATAVSSIEVAPGRPEIGLPLPPSLSRASRYDLLNPGRSLTFWDRGYRSG